MNMLIVCDEVCKLLPKTFYFLRMLGIQGTLCSDPGLLTLLEYLELGSQFCDLLGFIVENGAQVLLGGVPLEDLFLEMLVNLIVFLSVHLALPALLRLLLLV